jgi:hypothetical protein
MRQAWRSGGWTLALLAAAGCTRTADTVSPEVLAAHRERLVLAEEPDGVLGVLDVREMLVGPADADPDGGTAAVNAPAESLAAEQPVAPEAVVVIGRIGGVPNPWKQGSPDYPWSPGKAEFVIADPAAAAEVEDHDHGHAHDDPDHECPFCATAANSDVVALVRFKDEDGGILRIDARELFDLRGEETVVVRGKPQMLGDAKDGVVVVEADGLYVRR